MKITIRNLQKILPIHPLRIKRAVRSAAGSRCGRFSDGITIVFVADKQIRALNKKFHQADSATDVLTFDLGVEADVVVSADACRRNARVFNSTPEYELYLYVVHGILHLTGYQDAARSQSARMQKRAESILNQFPWLRHAHS